MTRPEFVHKFWHLAVAVGRRFGIAPVAILAHALKESGANNARAAARHNYFGFLKAGKHLVYTSDAAGFEAYAKRLSTTFSTAARASGTAEAFARALAFSSKPAYVNESPAGKQAYARTLTSIYKSVAADVVRLGLRDDVPAPDVTPLATRPVSLITQTIV